MEDNAGGTQNLPEFILLVDIDRCGSTDD